MFDGDWVAGYLDKLAEETRKLSILLEPKTLENLDGMTYRQKRIVRLAMSEHIQETCEEIIGYFIGIEDWRNTNDQMKTEIKKQIEYLYRVLTDYI